MSTIKERIVELVESQGKNVSTFFPSIGLSYSNFKGPQLKSSPSADILAKIKSTFPKVRVDWLLTGEGEMLDFDTPASEINEDILEKKLIEFFKKRDEQYQQILSQNSEIIRQNGEILKRVLESQDKNK